LAVSVLANTISLTPGTVSCDVSPDQKTLLIHSLHTTDHDEVIRQIHNRYETLLLEAMNS
jgi:multicomponent K+:H+ antiporter subunit E